MKAPTVKPPSVFPQTEEEPSPITLKAYFTGCALIGRLSGQEDAFFNTAVEQLALDACRMGELVYEQFIEENPSVVRNFNRKVGV
jgi:hypothetical protein